MTLPVRWKKSSKSTNGSACVEVDNELKRLRDSKNPSTFLSVDVRMLVRMLRSG